MEFLPIIISGLALVFSIVSFVLSYRQQRELQVTKHRLDIAIFDMSRDAVFEGRLGDWPAAFKLHGVDLSAASREGLRAEQIAYMVLSVSALVSFCGAKSTTVYEQLRTSDYRQRMFAQRQSRRAWGYARLCFPRATAEQVDKYLSATYDEKYAPM